MRELAKEFDKACDGLPTHRFTQIKRQGNACIYQRTKQDGIIFAFEVFSVPLRRMPKFANGSSEEYEGYPSPSDFGKTAWFCTSLERAEARFSELINRQEGNGQ